MLKLINSLFLLIIVLIINSCDGGLAPRTLEDKSFLNGKIIFKNHLPTDSVKAIRAVAFMKQPDSSIINDILQGNAYFNFETLPIGVDTVDFSFEIVNAPVNLVYIAAIMQTDTNIFSQRVIGVYTETGDKTKASTLNVQKGKSYNVRIDVDYNNLPPMPF